MGGDWLRRWGPALLVAAVLAAAAGGAAGGLGAPTWLAGAIAAVTALGSGAFAGWYFPARDQRRGLVEARRLVLDELADAVTDPLDAAAEPLALLRADRSPMPFRGRGRELRQLAEWRDRDPRGKGPAPSPVKASPVMLLGGPAGVGKSRLALEFASRLPGEWAAGWLHAGAGGAAIGAVAACGEPAAILVDDADGRDDVVPLLEALAERRGDPVIRVVLVTRSADGLRLALERQLDPRHAAVISRAEALELKPEGGSDDRARWFGEAVRAFAATLGLTPPALPEVFTGGRGDPAEPFVMIQARALLAVLGSGRSPGEAPDPRGLSFGEVAEALLAHERRRWRAVAPAWGLDGADRATLATVERLQSRSIAALALLGDDGDAAAEAVLRRIPELSDQLAMRLYAVAAAVRTLYPAGPDGAPRIQPDVIGEWFVVGQLAGNQALAAALRAGMSDEQAARALGLLARAADWIEAAGPLFGEFAGDDIRRQVLAATRTALTTEAGRHLLDTVVAAQLAAGGHWSVDQLRELNALISPHVLPQTRVGLDYLLVGAYRELAADDPGGYEPVLGSALNNLGTDLGRLGRHHEALDIARETVAIYRALAARDPDGHEADLANALNNLGVDLSRLGRDHEALDIARETVAIYRALVAANPDAHQPRLADVLSNLGFDLQKVGRYHEALGATQEAVTIYRALAAANPDAYQDSLADSLINLGVDLNSLGRDREALEVVEEAVALYRALAAVNPDAHRADLGNALSNVSVDLSRLGRDREALDAVEEAVTIYRALAAVNPDAHRADLGNALIGLGAALNRLGRDREALGATQEAVTIYRPLAAANPQAHGARLGGALLNLGAWLSRLGRHGEALDATREAVTLFRASAADNPGAHQASLADALINLGAWLSALGRHHEALDPTREAVTLYRALAAANPDANQPRFVDALTNLGVQLDQLDGHDEALAARAEAVGVYRELAARDAELYGAEYRRLLGELRREYGQRGMRDEAITRDLPGSPPVTPAAPASADAPAPPPGGMDGGEPAESVTDEPS